MQLETYISDLLYRYECVTIPEFGAFLTQQVSATIDDSSHVFFPPKKVLSFNEQIQKNDGLLAHYIAEVEKIPFEVANEKIAKRVKILKSYLTQGETLTFKNIGEIVFNNEGKILFEPTYRLNYLTDAFGLSSFESPVVNRELYKAEAEAIERVIPIGVTPEKRKSKPYLRYAAVALIALTLGGFTASNYYVNQIETHNQLAQEAANQQLETKIQEATFSLNPIPAITLNVTKQTGNYHIVAGAFRVKENSEKMVNTLKTLGYPARYTGINKYGLHEVIYASYETGQDALKAVRDIRKSHNKDAWIDVRNLDETTTKGVPLTSNRIGIKENPMVSTKAEDNIVTQVNDSDFEKNPNIIPIIKDVETVKSGFYLVFDACKDIAKRDEFIKKLQDAGFKGINYFFDKESGSYLVYQKKFDTLEVAVKALKAFANPSFDEQAFVVKVEN